MRPLNPLLEKFHCAQTVFFRAADSISAEKWNTKPDPHEWSAAELVAHLMMVKRVILGGADRITQKRARAIPFLKRFHLPMRLVESRILRRKSPLRLDHSLLSSKQEMRGGMQATREPTLAFLEETAKKDPMRFWEC